MWLARISTSAASRSALCSSLRPRCASTTARNASSGFAKFESVDSAIRTSVVAGRTRQRGIERRPGRMPETGGDVTVGPQQIGGPGCGVVAYAGKTFGIDKPIIAADADHTHVIGRVNGSAVAELQQRETHAAADEGVRQVDRFAGGRHQRRI